MKKLLTTIVGLIGSCVFALAGDTQVINTAPVPTTSFGTAKAFATSIIEDSDAIYGGGVSLEVPVVWNLKLEVTGSFLEDDIASAGANLLYYIPVTQGVSLYTLAGGGYEFETEEWHVNVGGGVSYALDQQWSVFADGQYNFLTDGSGDGVVTVRLGVGYSF